MATIEEALTRAAHRRTVLPPPRVRRSIREAAGLSQGELADVLGVHRISVSRYESGQREPRGKLRLAYSEALRAMSPGPEVSA